MRDAIVEILKKELIGPDPVPSQLQENGEEILIGEPPRMRYGAGILFPQETVDIQREANDETEVSILDELLTIEEEQEEIQIEGERDTPGSLEENSDVNDDTVNLTNSRLPSAMGFSCFTDMPNSGYLVEVIAGRYKSGDFAVEDGDGNISIKKAFFRESLNKTIDIPISKLPSGKNKYIEFEIERDGEPTGLVLNIRNRTSSGTVDMQSQLYTFTLINRLVSDGGQIDNEKCFFQVEFSVCSKDDGTCFLPYPIKTTESSILDDQSIRLLYRNHRTYAIGHGCAPSWEESNNCKAKRIKSDIIPKFDMKTIIPTSFPDLSLNMYDMSDCVDESLITQSLLTLCEKYEIWIKKQQSFTNDELSGELKNTANRHIDNCRVCLIRMKSGINLIKENPQVRRAFALMNRAMLMQQLRYGLKLREWNVSDGIATIESVNYPNIHNRESWPDWPENKLGIWRPFQIAFILMNLRSMTESSDPERSIVDIIWFPTGGGKTEAYLGLTAFTIFIRRMRNKHDAGTTVLMRYTLRLLTAQQFQRAASLICACEMIRREEAQLGEIPITIGLWVGDSLTPNRRADAITAFNQLIKGSKENGNRFVVLKCPWCGAQMGPIKVGHTTQVKGYRRQRNTITFQCHNETCDFSRNDNILPLKVIDEDIYQEPPTLVIGTVDKFAMLPWKPEGRSMFGFRDQGEQVTPPDLIIQDELHLISGPLGSMVGHYETFIMELCRDRESGRAAKIIASTATISRAKEQAHALYNCGEDNVFQFPPQCIIAGESFFATEDKVAKGRMYVGVHASALPSHATTQIRVIASLLQGTKSVNVKNEKERDPYWTIINYFNSLRELGHAATLVRADIREYLNALWMRKKIHKTDTEDPRRFINRAIELTSRIPNNEIPESLQALEVEYPSEDKYPVDICLATNMISVGVDVPRLGLMTVIGQPKTTSEYIQATSRVGRSKDGPGLVVILYNTSKPRDRSHYEHFYSYHSSIYSQVEPTSVTPYSTPVIERALHALLVGFVRYFGNNANLRSPQPSPSNDLVEWIRSVIEERVIGVDTGETINTMKLLNERIDEWIRYLPAKYGDFSPPTEELPLMHPAGSTPLEEWNEKSWQTPTSMRNVDSSCEAEVIRNYVINERI